MKYKGIELEGLDKKVKLSHSRVMETDEGTDWIDKLLTCDKAALTPTQFHEVSALSSVINMDYQICNGGISQYVFNGYHEDCAPYSDDDVAHLGQSGQVAIVYDFPLEVGTLVAVDENLATREINHAHASIRTARSTSVPMRHSPR